MSPEILKQASKQAQHSKQNHYVDVTGEISTRFDPLLTRWILTASGGVREICAPATRTAGPTRGTWTGD